MLEITFDNIGKIAEYQRLLQDFMQATHYCGDDGLLGSRVRDAMVHESSVLTGGLDVTRQEYDRLDDMNVVHVGDCYKYICRNVILPTITSKDWDISLRKVVDIVVKDGVTRIVYDEIVIRKGVLCYWFSDSDPDSYGPSRKMDKRMFVGDLLKEKMLPVDPGVWTDVMTVIDTSRKLFNETLIEDEKD